MKRRRRLHKGFHGSLLRRLVFQLRTPTSGEVTKEIQILFADRQERLRKNLHNQRAREALSLLLPLSPRAYSNRS